MPFSARFQRLLENVGRHVGANGLCDPYGVVALPPQQIDTDADVDLALSDYHAFAAAWTADLEHDLAALETVREGDRI